MTNSILVLPYVTILLFDYFCFIPLIDLARLFNFLPLLRQRNSDLLFLCFDLSFHLLSLFYKHKLPKFVFNIKREIFLRCICSKTKTAGIISCRFRLLLIAEKNYSRGIFDMLTASQSSKLFRDGLMDFENSKFLAPVK